MSTIDSYYSEAEAPTSFVLDLGIYKSATITTFINIIAQKLVKVIAGKILRKNHVVRVEQQNINIFD